MQLRQFQLKTQQQRGGKRPNESEAGYRKRTMTAAAAGMPVVRKRAITTKAGPAVGPGGLPPCV